MVYRSPEYKKFRQTKLPRTPFDQFQKAAEAARLRREARIIQGLPDTRPEPTPTIKGQPIVERDPASEGTFKRWGKAALEGLITGQEYGGGILRAGIQAIQPGIQEREYKLMEEARRIRQDTGASPFSPVPYWKAARNVSVADEGFEITTPFEDVGFDFQGHRVRLLPHKITGRGTAEFLGDPLIPLTFLPFVGVPIRAIEMGAIGAIKGAVGASAGAIAKAAATGSAREILKATVRAAPKVAFETVEETVKGVTRSADIERRILKRAWTGRAKPSGKVTELLDEPTPTHVEWNASTGSMYGPSEPFEAAIEKQLDNFTSTLVKPFERFRKSLPGKFILGSETKSFRQVFGNTKLGRVFIERVHGMRGLVPLTGNRVVNRVAKAIHWSNLSDGRNLQGTGAQARVFEALEKGIRMIGGKARAGKALFDFDENDYINGIYRNRNGELIPNDPRILKRLGKRWAGRNHAVSIMENVNYDSVTKTIRSGVKTVERRAKKGEKTPLEYIKTTVDADGNVRIDFNVSKNGRIVKGKDRGYHVILSREQADFIQDTIRYLNDAGKFGYNKEISLIAKDNALVKKYKLANPDGTINEDKVMDLIGWDPKNRRGESILKEKFKNKSEYYRRLTPGRGVARGANYVHRALKNVMDANEAMNDGIARLTHTATAKKIPKGKKLSVDFAQDELTDDILGSIKNRGTSAGRFSEIVESYSKSIIKKRSRDDLISSLDLIIRQASRKKFKGTFDKTLEEMLEEAIEKKPSAFYKDVKKHLTGGVTLTEATAKALTDIDKTAGKLMQRQFGMTEGGPKAVSVVLKWLADEVFAPLRLFKAGNDFGFLGINILPLAFLNPLKYAQVMGKVMKDFGVDVLSASTKLVGGRGEKGHINYLKLMLQNAGKIQEMSEAGIHLSSFGADLYDAMIRPGSAIGIAGKIPLIGNRLERVVAGYYSPFERAFYRSVDMSRMTLYDSYRPLWQSIDNEAERLAVRRQFADSINYSTGGYSVVEAGLTVNQRALESSWVFFSPRYTRASMGLISMAFDNTIQGAEARRALTNMLTVGTMMYLHTTTFLGVEPVLDPSDPDYMTIPIGEDRVGPAGFHRQFMSFMARVMEDLIDNAGQALTFRSDRPGVTISEKLFNFPIIRFLRGRTNLGTGYAIDLAVGSDYLGHEIEGWQDKAKHAARLPIPFWAEHLLFTDPYRAGTGAIATEFFVGARTYSKNIYARRSELRDELAMRNYGENPDVAGWDSLTKAQKKVLEGENPELAQFKEDIRTQRGDRAGGFDRTMEKYNEKNDEIDDEYHDAIERYLVTALDSRNDFGLPDLRKANGVAQQEKRRKKKELRKGDEFAPLLEYWEGLRSTVDKDGNPKPAKFVVQYPDVLMDIWYDMRNEFTRDDGSYDWAAKDAAEQEFFRTYPGMEGYVRELNRTYSEYDQDTPGPLKEYYYYDDRYNDMYFNKTTDAVFNNFPSLQPYMEQYNNVFRYLGKEQRDGITQGRGLVTVIVDGEPRQFNASKFKRIVNRVNEYQRELRKLDPVLDRFIFKWGVEGSHTVYHLENKPPFEADPPGDSRFRLHNYDIETDLFPKPY